MEKDLVSIIIPCYNDANYIKQSVDSALNQTYPNIEVIVVDDGSNSETKKVLADLEHKITQLITQENRGQSVARNRGIAVAKGEYIIVLDSDDYFEPTFCEKAMAKILKEPNSKLISCFAVLLFENNTTGLYEPKGGTIEDFLFTNSAIGNALFKKEDWILAGGYDELMRDGWEDWEFYIRLLGEGGQCFILPEPLFNYRKLKQTTTKRANEKKYENWRYILNKHTDLYKKYYPILVDFFLEKLQREELEKIKNAKRIDYRLGQAILTPFRSIKKLWK